MKLKLFVATFAVITAAALCFGILIYLDRGMHEDQCASAEVKTGIVYYDRNCTPIQFGYYPPERFPGWEDSPGGYPRKH